MLPSSATANDGVLTVSGEGSLTTLLTTAPLATSMATTLSVVVAAYNCLPSGLNARLLSGAPTANERVTVLVAGEITDTVPPKVDTYTPPAPTATSVGEVP